MKPGEQWGAPCAATPDIEVEGADCDLALAVARHPGALVRFVPTESSQLARAVGLRAGGELRHWAVPMDALQLDDGRLGVNMVILGTPPDEIRWWSRSFALSVDERRDWVLSAVVATGQFHAGNDLAPRSHPADGAAELQLYRVIRSQRPELRRRIRAGIHLPHPDITQRRVTTVTFHSAHNLRIELDGVSQRGVRELSVTVVPNAYRLLL